MYLKLWKQIVAAQQEKTLETSGLNAMQAFGSNYLSSVSEDWNSNQLHQKRNGESILLKIWCQCVIKGWLTILWAKTNWSLFWSISAQREKERKNKKKKITRNIKSLLVWNTLINNNKHNGRDASLSLFVLPFVYIKCCKTSSKLEERCMKNKKM